MCSLPPGAPLHKLDESERGLLFTWTDPSQAEATAAPCDQEELLKRRRRRWTAQQDALTRKYGLEADEIDLLGRLACSPDITDCASGLQAISQLASDNIDAG